MPTESKPKRVDGPRQQITTGMEVRECLLKANPRLLIAHANNSQQERNCGNTCCKKPKIVDGTRQQLTTGTEVRNAY